MQTAISRIFWACRDDCAKSLPPEKEGTPCRHAADSCELARSPACQWWFVGAGTAAAEKRISQINQHFNEPDKSIAPWSFVAGREHQRVSTAEHPGLATIYEAGRGQDVKGLLERPIALGDSRLPWEFQTSLVQSFNATAGVGAKTQINYAIGLNVVVTFSDPATWPADRGKRPADDPRVSTAGGTPGLHRRGGRRTAAILDRAASGKLSRLGTRRPGRDRDGGLARFPTSGLATAPNTPARPALNSSFVAWLPAPRSCRSASSSTPRTAGTCARSTAPVRQDHRHLGDRPDHLRPTAGFPTCSAATCRRSKARTRCCSGTATPSTMKSKMAPVVAPKPEPPNPAYEYYVDYCVFFGSEPAAVRGVLRRLRHRRLPGPLAGAGAMHAHGHALAPGPPDAQATRARAWGPGLARPAAPA